MKIIIFATAVILGLWAYAYAPLLSLGWAAEWMLEDATWAQGLVAPAFAPRGLTGWTWTWAATPYSAHVLSLMLHVIITSLVGLYAWRLGLSPLTAWAASLLFLVNPVTVETVAYAASRSEQISALGVLAACLAATLTTAWKWPLIVVAVAVGVLGKESGIVAFGLVPLTLWMTRQAWRGPAALSYIVLSEGAHYRYGTYDAIANLPDYAPQISAWDWVCVQATAVFRIVITALTGLGMTPDFDYDRVPTRIQILCLCLLMASVSLLWQRRWMLTFCVAGVLLSVAPRFVVQTPTSYLNEHQFYVPLIWLMIGMAGGLVYVGEVLYVAICHRWGSACIDHRGAVGGPSARGHAPQLSTGSVTL